MSPLKKTFCLALTLIILVGCQQKQNKKQSLRSGRGLRGSTQVDKNSAQSCGTYKVEGKSWGEVVAMQNQQIFQQEVQMLTNPVLMTLPLEDQLGMVSGQSGQFTGVRFWGHAMTVAGGQYAAIDPGTAQIRIEIYDDKACQLRSDGTVRPVIPIHIGAGLPGFISAEGSVSGARARLTFVDIYGSIVMDGQISNSYWTGTLSYTTQQTGPQARILGRFTVPYCGFFTCTL